MPDVKIQISEESDRYLRWRGGDEVSIEGEYGIDESTFKVSLRALANSIDMIMPFVGAEMDGDNASEDGTE